MNGISFILSQSGSKAPPPAPKQTPPGGGKLSVSQSADIVARAKAGEVRAALAREYGVTWQAVYYLVKKAQKENHG